MHLLRYFPKYFHLLLMLTTVFASSSDPGYPKETGRLVTCYTCNTTTDPQCQQSNPSAMTSCKIDFDAREGCMTIRMNGTQKWGSPKVISETYKDCINVFTAQCFYEEAKFEMSIGKCYKRLVTEGDYSRFVYCLRDKEGKLRPVDKGWSDELVNENQEEDARTVEIAACACNDRDLCNEHAGNNMNPDTAVWAPEIQPEPEISCASIIGKDKNYLVVLILVTMFLL